MEAAYQKLTQLAAPVFQGYAGLPFPVYVVSTEGMFLLYNQAARTLFSDKLFELGRAALERGQFQTAVNAFSEIMDRDNEDPNRLHNYLGLAAHLRAVGTAAREYVLHSLKIKDIALTADLIGQSRKYHFMLSNFATADHLEAMWSDFAAQR